jgi:threonine dehydrogenase-like Zn-dependent dehydrogenase
MRGAILYGAGDVRFDERDNPKIIQPTDAIIRMSAACVHRTSKQAIGDSIRAR